MVARTRVRPGFQIRIVILRFVLQPVFADPIQPVNRPAMKNIFYFVHALSKENCTSPYSSGTLLVNEVLDPMVKSRFKTIHNRHHHMRGIFW